MMAKNARKKDLSKKRAGYGCYCDGNMVAKQCEKKLRQKKGRVRLLSGW
jgi:hypothetical protein